MSDGFWPREADVALNQAARSMRPDQPQARWGPVLLTVIDGPKYAVSGQHHHRRVGLLLHQPFVLWKATLDYPSWWRGPRPPGPALDWGALLVRHRLHTHRPAGRPADPEHCAVRSVHRRCRAGRAEGGGAAHRRAHSLWRCARALLARPLFPGE